MKLFYISAILFSVTLILSYFSPTMPPEANISFIINILVIVTALYTAYAFWKLNSAKKRALELAKMISMEDKRTLGKFLIHEWRGLIHNVGIQAELMERAENAEGVRVNCGMLKKLLHEETDVTAKADAFFSTDKKNMKKSSKTIKSAVADVELIQGKSRIKLILKQTKRT